MFTKSWSRDQLMQKAYSGRLYFSKCNYLEFFKHPLVFISGYPEKIDGKRFLLL